MIAIERVKTVVNKDLDETYRFTPMERTRFSRHFVQVDVYRLIRTIWLTGSAMEGDPTRVAAGPTAAVPFDWLSVFVLMHATLLNPVVAPALLDLTLYRSRYSD